MSKVFVNRAGRRKGDVLLIVTHTGIGEAAYTGAYLAPFKLSDYCRNVFISE